VGVGGKCSALLCVHIFELVTAFLEPDKALEMSQKPDEEESTKKNSMRTIMKMNQRKRTMKK